MTEIFIDIPNMDVKQSEMFLESAIKDMKIAELESNNANILLTLVTNGITPNP